MRFVIIMSAVLILTALILTGCGGGSSSSAATVRLLVADAPVVLPDGTTVDAVNVPIDQIVLLGEADNEGTAVMLYDSGGAPSTIDLLSLANMSLTQLANSPVATSLGTVTVPAGHYSQMRLILGSGANVMMGANAVELKVPSGMQTGLKVNINLDLGAATLQDVLLDFNLAKLDYQPNQSRFILPPNALRLVAMTQTAGVQGTVTVTPPAGGLTGDVSVRITLCDTTGTPILVNGVADATIDTIVTIPVGQTSATYTLNAVPTTATDYQLRIAVTYGAQTPAQTPVNVTMASGQTATRDITITGLQ